MLLKQKSLLLPRNLALETFGKLLIVFSTRVNLLYLLCSTDHKCCLLHLIKQNYYSLPVFPSRTNLELHNISMVKNVIANLDLSKASGPERVLFSRFLKVSSVVPVFKNVGERSTAK